MDDDKPIVYVGIFFLIILVVAIIFEVGTLMYAYTHADTIRCNFIFCEFTTERTTQESRIERITIENCYVNGKEINCTNIDMTGLRP